MDTQAIWAERVAGWRASGLPSARYCEGKPFSAGGLRYWASRLQRGQPILPAKTAPRLARVEVVRKIRRASVATAGLSDEASAVASAVPGGGDELAVECGGMRVTIRPGFNRETLAAVLDILVARGGRGGAR